MLGKAQKPFELSACCCLRAGVKKLLYVPKVCCPPVSKAGPFSQAFAGLNWHPHNRNSLCEELMSPTMDILGLVRVQHNNIQDLTELQVLLQPQSLH